MAGYNPGKLLGKAAGAGGTTNVTLYNLGTDSPATNAVLSCIKAVNKDAAAQTIRIAVGATSTSPGSTEWDVYDWSIDPKETLALCEGLCLDATNKYIIVTASDTDVHFKVYGAVYLP